MIENFDDNTLSKALGFKIPTNNLKQTLTSISNEPLKTKIFSHLQNYQGFDPTEFEKNISKYHKPVGHNASKIKIEVNKEKGSKTIFSDAMTMNELSLTEKAYFLAYNPERLILSDLEANKLKSVSPPMIPKANPLDDPFIDVKPLDPSKSNLENGKIGGNKEIYPNEIEGESQINQNFQQKSYCICKKPYKEGELMIRCDYDQCEGWYHLECVGFKDKTEEEITKIKWYCSEDCRDKATRPSSLNYKPIKKKNKGTR